jgi:NAD+ diphosphatase
LIADGQTLARRISSDRYEIILSASAGEKEKISEAERYFLGQDAHGVSYFVVKKDRLPDPVETDVRHVGVRDAVELLSPSEASLLAYAVALENWHSWNQFCPRCGNITVLVPEGNIRRCSACSADHYPRTDPTVIMLVVDAEERVLLGRRPGWQEGRFSVLAGYVEPGESLEAAVVREVAEEVGIRIESAVYMASEPWPFPGSVMMGFIAHAAPGSSHISLEKEEIEEAIWISREEFRCGIERGDLISRSGISMATLLIEFWYGGPLPKRSFQG